MHLSIRKFIPGVVRTTLLLSVLLLWAASAFSTFEPPPELTKNDIMRLGERMYRQGILPSGDSMPAFIRGDIEVDSSAFSCSSCHLRAGLGSFEGGVVTPPTSGNKLYKPYRRPPSLGDTADQAGRFIYAKTVIERPPYTRESLAHALRFGTDPAGQTFNDIMPRYPLSDRDLSILISYLEGLSSELSPGVTATEFRFSTIITEDVSTEDRNALILPLQSFIAQKNQQAAMYQNFVKLGYSPTPDMKYAFRKASLDIWLLQGAPETWPAQLREYNRRNPAFAVLGGISNRDWKPIHDFCEAERLPCLFPITDFPVVNDTDWYTYYFNKGFAQEGEAAAAYINRQESATTESSILQIIQASPEGIALGSGFQNKWQKLGRSPVTSVTLTSVQLEDKSEIARLFDRHKPGTVLLWADAGSVHNLQNYVAMLPPSGKIFISSLYLDKKTTAIAENIRDRIYITFPYRLTPYVGPKTGGYDSKTPIFTSARDLGERRIASRSTTMLQQATLQGLNLIYDNLFRDHLLDIMSMQMDVIVKDYERLSFGPGQRYVSKGCYIIQLGSGPDPALIPKSEWVIH